jgi:hypothetical protein
MISKEGMLVLYSYLPEWSQRRRRRGHRCITKLLADDGAAGDDYGTSVLISRDEYTIVVGAEWNDFDSSTVDSGAAYFFRTIDSTTTTPSVQWTQTIQKVTTTWEFPLPWKIMLCWWVLGEMILPVVLKMLGPCIFSV